MKNVEVGGIMEPNQGYRSLSASNIPDFDDEFVGLFVENEKYRLRLVEITFEEGFSECTNDTILAFIPNEDCLFLFPYFRGYNTALIKAVDEGRKIEMIPDSHFSFTYNCINYTLQANGEVENSNINNYTLSFCKTDCQTKQILVAHNYMQDAVVTILFIGDLDGDKEPDIILDAADNYENRRIQLFLSSSKQGEELLHLEAENFDWFDC